MFPPAAVLVCSPGQSLGPRQDSECLKKLWRHHHAVFKLHFGELLGKHPWLLLPHDVQQEPGACREMCMSVPQLAVVIFYRCFFCVSCSCTGVRKLLSFSAPSLTIVVLIVHTFLATLKRRAAQEVHMCPKITLKYTMDRSLCITDHTLLGRGLLPTLPLASPWMHWGGPQPAWQ